MPNLALRVEALSKSYAIGAERTEYATFAETINHLVRSPYRRARAILRGDPIAAGEKIQIIWALSNVNFTVEQGEVVGIIGRNGSGKSTLLKLLSRITAPTEGFIELFGQVGALLEVGTGFHQELTGRENIFFNGAILGMTSRRIQRKFDEIVDFAGVAQFIDTPVKHYSTGMRLRLGFAVAAHLEPDILVVDEVLAVGDAEFQKKSMGKMSSVAQEGRTVLFVSHNMLAIQQLCTRALLLERGQLIADDDVFTVIKQYAAQDESQTITGHVDLSTREDRRGKGELRFAQVTLLDENQEATNDIAVGAALSIYLIYHAEARLVGQSLQCAIRVDDHYALAIATFSTEFMNQSFAVTGTQGELLCRVPRLPLLVGRYSLHLWAQVGNDVQDSISGTLYFDVVHANVFQSGKLPDRSRHGVIFVQHDWQ